MNYTYTTEIQNRYIDNRGLPELAIIIHESQLFSHT